MALYRDKVQSGELSPDPIQELAAEKLQSLHHALADYRPSTGNSGWLARFGLGRREEDEAPQGLYLYGPVGRGKSMLMDLFYQSASIPAKRRLHFHEFMRDVHARIHNWREGAAKTQRKDKDADPIPRFAREVAEEAWLLCLDELEVHDIADAMIVGRLFEHLMANGVVIVTTSNRAPSELYKDGLQRDRFLPFIDLISHRLDLLELASDRDYRLGRLKGSAVYHTPLGEAADKALDEAFANLTADAEHPPAPDRVVVHGREIPVPLAAAGVARFDFKDICEQPLGTHDYLQIATLYHTVILANVPRLDPERIDVARRFVTFIDALYEHKVMLVCAAEVLPQNLYPAGKGAFEFERTVSRLMEMQSETYMRLPHLT